jgi:hypothetical protein
MASTEVPQQLAQLAEAPNVTSPQAEHLVPTSRTPGSGSSGVLSRSSRIAILWLGWVSVAGTIYIPAPIREPIIPCSMRLLESGGKHSIGEGITGHRNRVKREVAR